MKDEIVAQDKTGFLRRAAAAAKGHPLPPPKVTNSYLTNFLGFSVRRKKHEIE